MSDKPPKMTVQEILKAMASVARDAFRLSPVIVIIQIVDSIVSAILPIATTYLAALTTTALADAYTGVDGSSQRVLIYVVLTVALGILSIAWSSVRGYIEAATRYKTDVLITDQMTQHFLQLEFWRYDDVETVNMLDRANKFAYMFPYLFSRISGILSSLVSTVVVLISLFVINPWLGLGLFLTIIPSLVVQMKLSKLSANHWRSNSQTRRRADWINWILNKKDSVAEVRLYGLVDFLINLRNELRNKDERTRIEFERQFMLKKLGADVLRSVVELGALVWIVLEIIAHRQPIGQFLFIQQMVSRAFGGMESIVSAISEFDEDMSNLVDYRNFRELPVITDGGKELPSMDQSLEIDNLFFRYTGSDNYILKGVSMSLEKGKKIAIVGENGAGKTTLIKLIIGIYHPDKGRVAVDGLSLRDVRIESWHNQISLLSQDVIDYDFATAYENVWYGDVSRPKDMEKVKQALKLAEASDFVDKLPKGGDSYIDRWMETRDGVGGVALSGGQKQRLALARNFYRDTPIMVLDEPTSAMDALAESRIFRRLFAMKDKTIVIVSHRLTTIRQADVVYMLKEGRVVEVGSVDELISRKGEFYHMFQSQI